mmetsp:Transcript_2569/g.3980  ORF Transcript_2569/g.3980 Transcript_2569/m.3980 type:complete len:618 (+) Transcript_2569:99-1952(+)
MSESGTSAASAAAEAKAKGNTAFSAKRYDEAIQHFTEAIKHDATDHVFFSNRSACYASIGKYEEAREDGEQCVKLKPDWHKGYARKGLAEFFLERWDDAAETYKAGLKLAPEDPGLKEGLQKAMDAKYDVAGARPAKRQRTGGGAPPGSTMLGDFDDTMLAQAAARNPKIAEYMKDDAFMKKLNAFRGILRMSQDSASAEGMLSTLVREEPRLLVTALAARGINIDSSFLAPREERREPEQSKPAPPSAETAKNSTPSPAAASAPSKPPQKEVAVKEDSRTPEQKEADDLKAKGNELYKKRCFDEAISLYEQAIAKQPNDMTYYFNKCAAWIEMGDEHYQKVLDTCQDLLNRRYEMNSANPGGASFEKVAKVYSRMASVYERMKKFDDAIAMYNKALTEDNARQTRNALRECERAKEKFEKEAYLDSGKAEEQREQGNECFKNKDWAGAKRCYDEALRRNPSDAKLYSNRAAALTKLLAYPDALRDLDECLKLDPKFIKAYSRKGAAHFFMKEYNKALEAYEKGLAEDPSNEECQKGKEQVMSKIMETSRSDEVDEEQVRHAMADPEIQRILKDPQVNMFLKQMKEDPKKAQEAIRKDQQLASALDKLIAAGIVRIR